MASNTNLLKAYQRCIYLYLFYSHPLREERWARRHAMLLRRFIAELHPGEAISNNPEVEAYLAWTEPRDTVNVESEVSRKTINTYRSEGVDATPSTFIWRPCTLSRARLIRRP